MALWARRGATFLINLRSSSRVQPRSPRATRSRATSARGNVTGQLLNKRTKGAIANATVSFVDRISSSKSFTTKTMKDGRFSLTLPAGNYYLNLKAKGYRSLSRMGPYRIDKGTKGSKDITKLMMPQ